MAEIPKPETPKLSQAELSAWFEMSENLKKLKVQEILLRKHLFKIAFPDPEVGTNNYDLDGGYVLKGRYAYDYKVDQGAFDAMKEKLMELKVRPDDLVVYKPELAKTAYNKLDEEQKHLFDQCLIIKPSSPSMEIVLPAKAKAKQEAAIMKTLSVEADGAVKQALGVTGNPE